MSKRQFLVTNDGSHTLFVPELNETYHSTHGAIQESNHVFIEQGLKFLYSVKSYKKIRIFELGFGTGLNALLTAIFAEVHQLDIEYDSIEAFPLSSSEITKLNYPQLIHEDSTARLFQRIHGSPWDKKVYISSCFSLLKVEKVLQTHELDKEYDLCFFDAFAPSKQPEMWEKNILEKIYYGLSEKGVFVTYCAKGQLKRDLRDIGFDVETLPGPPGKKEMVRGIK